MKWILVPTLPLVLALPCGAAERGEAPAGAEHTVVGERSEAGAWSCLIAGAAMIGAGGVAWWIGRGEQSDVENAGRNDDGAIDGISQREAARLQRDAESHKRWGTAGLAVGGALAIAGFALSWWPPDRVEREPAPVQPEPSVRPFTRLHLLVGPGAIGVSGQF